VFHPTKPKIFNNPAYRKVTLELIDLYRKKVRWIVACPDCKDITGLNLFGFLVDNFEKPEQAVMVCRDCEHLFTTPVFV
jgi:uncharacterized protein YbaR (Trm112 family)